MKKIVLSISIVLLIGIFIFPVSAINKIFVSENSEVEINSKINISLDLSSISYNQSIIKLYSSKSISNIEVNEEVNNNINNINFENNELTIEYDKTVSSLDNIDFIFDVDNTIKEGDIITFRVVISNKFDEADFIEEYCNVTIKASEKNTDNNQESIQNNNIIKNTTNNIKTSNTNSISISNVGFSNISQTKYNGSTNNYLSSLSVSGYEFDKSFKKEISSYFLTVDTDSIKINTKKDNSKASVVVSGNTNLKIGLNKVLISVTSQSGNVRYYRIYVTREASKGE